MYRHRSFLVLQWKRWRKPGSAMMRRHCLHVDAAWMRLTIETIRSRMQAQDVVVHIHAYIIGSEHLASNVPAINRVTSSPHLSSTSLKQPQLIIDLFNYLHSLAPAS